MRESLGGCDCVEEKAVMNLDRSFVVGLNPRGADVGRHTSENTREDNALWSGTNKNRDVSAGALSRPFARPFAPLTHSLSPDCSLRSRPPLRSLVRSLAHFAHSLARGKVNF